MDTNEQALGRDPLDYFGNQPGAVLLSDQIEYYCKNLAPPLITNFSRDCLKPARYNLRLGNSAHIEGRPLSINAKKPLLLKPHEVAIVETFEAVNLPAFLIGRWNLRVDMVYEGLLWVGALQVDPGWKGKLPCPIYNLSNRTIVISHMQKLFAIDFVRTTAFVPAPTDKYPYCSQPYRQQEKTDLASHDKFGLKSAVSDTEQKVESMRGQLFFFTTAGISAVAILFAALGVLSTASIGTNTPIGSTLLNTDVPIALIAIISSLFALLLSTYAVTRNYHPNLPSTWLLKSVKCLAGIFILWGFYLLLAPFIVALQWPGLIWILTLPIWYGVIQLFVGVLLATAVWDVFEWKRKARR